MIIWKYQIGDVVHDDNRHFVITDRKIEEKIYSNTNKKYKYKMYQYTCFKCGWSDGWIEESNLTKGRRCRCCTGQIAVKGINTLGDKRPDLIQYFENHEDAFCVLPRTDNVKVNIICPLCKNKIKITPDHLTTRGFTCRKCGDGFSYPEKFLYNLLQQVNASFITQLNSSHFSWVGSFRYDFYLCDYNCIIETHGRQHYENIQEAELKIIQKNDKNKKELAEKNSIDYIVLDCRESSVNWIKNSICNSELSSFFNLSNVNWQECHQHSIHSLVKVVSDCWNEHQEWSTQNICNYVGLKKTTVVKYLKQAKELGWCDYSTELSYQRRRISISRGNSIPIKVYKDGCFLFTYPSATKLANDSKDLLGVRLTVSSIRDVCRGICKTYKGYYFEDTTEVNYV